MEEEKWLIWSNEHRGWWKPGHNGYTQLRSAAGHYSFREAEQIVRMANRYHTDDNKEPFEAMLPEDLP